MEQIEVLFYNGHSEPVGYELLDIDTAGLTKKQIKEKIEEIMQEKYGLEWDSYSDCIYLLNVKHLKKFNGG